MNHSQELARQLQAIDRKGYPAYKSLMGTYDFGRYVLSIDHVQGDPFASPSAVRVTVKQTVAGFPAELFDMPHKRAALADLLSRLFSQAVRKCCPSGSGSGNSGRVVTCRCGQEVLERTAMQISQAAVEARFAIGFPARGRTIDARVLETILFSALPRVVEQSMIFTNLDIQKIRGAVELAEDQQAIREELKTRGLVSFIADGAVLPRESGVSEKPMDGGVPFRSPETLAVELTLPNGGLVRGMGIPCGITLIVGGGYHGKSTLLKAIERGVYNHIRGDGRELVITDAAAVKVRAEDGRAITGTDISPFITNLPNKKDTVHFTTENASGSTSQAANMAEALEAGARAFLIDEDTSATNFMIRDEMMQKLICRNDEPITPFTDLVRPVYETLGVSSVLVVGSSGSYFPLADTVIQMKDYEPEVVTERAKALCAPQEVERTPMRRIRMERVLQRGCVERGSRGIKIKSRGLDTLTVNREDIDMRYLEQLVEPEQVTALGYLMRYIEERLCDGHKTLAQLADEAERVMDKQGFLSILTGPACADFLSRPRKHELMACFSRYRLLRLNCCEGGKNPS